MKLTEIHALVLVSQQGFDVIIPDTYTSIGSSAFYNFGINSVMIPDSVTRIGDYAFEGNNLAGVQIPDSVTFIGEYAFADNRIKSIELPDSIINIGDNAFSENKLTSIELPANLKEINDETFSHNLLTDLNVPKTITKIGDKAFYGNNIENLKFNEGLASIGYEAFYANPIDVLEIPESVEEIGLDAFGYLDRLFIPENPKFEEYMMPRALEIFASGQIPQDGDDVPGIGSTIINSLEDIEYEVYGAVGEFWLIEPLITSTNSFQRVFVKGNRETNINGTSRNELLMGDGDKDIFTGQEGADGFLIDRPNKFKKKNTDLITDFNPDEGDIILIGKHQFQLENSIDLAEVSGKKSKKAAKKSSSMFVYDLKNGNLYFNQNKAEKGWGDGGTLVTLEGIPDITVENLEIYSASGIIDFTENNYLDLARKSPIPERDGSIRGTDDNDIIDVQRYYSESIIFERVMLEEGSDVLVFDYEPFYKLNNKGGEELQTARFRIDDFDPLSGDGLLFDGDIFNQYDSTLAIANSSKDVRKLLTSATSFIFDASINLLYYNANGPKPGLSLDGMDEESNFDWYDSSFLSFEESSKNLDHIAAAVYITPTTIDPTDSTTDFVDIDYLKIASETDLPQGSRWYRYYNFLDDNSYNPPKVVGTKGDDIIEVQRFHDEDRFYDEIALGRGGSDALIFNRKPESVVNKKGKEELESATYWIEEFRPLTGDLLVFDGEVFNRFDKLLEVGGYSKGNKWLEEVAATSVTFIFKDNLLYYNENGSDPGLGIGKMDGIDTYGAALINFRDGLGSEASTLERSIILA